MAIAMITGYGKPDQSEAEADGELVKADADTESERRKPVPATEPAGLPFLRWALVVNQHEDAEPSNRRGGHVVGDAPDNAGQATAGGHADQRHARLEHDEDRRYP